jgi:polysaccharide export outer membrane protein
MRTIRFATAITAALSLTGCVHQQAATTDMIDPQSGQPIAVVQSDAQQPQASNRNSDRGFFNSRKRTASSDGQPQVQQPAVLQYKVPPLQAAAQQAARPLTSAPPPAQYAASSQTASDAYAYAPAEQPYTLDSGDRLRVVVFGQDGISNSYIVDAGGYVNLPLIGIVRARGHTTRQLSQAIAERLKQGYVREPHVAIEVETYRPFFILGEVTNPGQYPYVTNMTAEMAVAIAGGFAPRARKSTVTLTRNTPLQRFSSDVPLDAPLRPGDTIMVKERWF